MSEFVSKPAQNPALRPFQGSSAGSAVELVQLLRVRNSREPGQPPPNLSGASLRRADLSGLNLSGLDLSGADLSEANLSGAKLLKTRLAGANLEGARLSKAELAASDLSDCCLERVQADSAGFGMAKLKGARLFEAHLKNATFTMSDLSSADLRCAHLDGARLREANLNSADLTRADLTGADMEESSVLGACFQETVMQGARLRRVHHYEQALWTGVDIRNVNFTGAYLMRRFILDENFLHEFRGRDRVSSWIYYLWWATSDCGRSLSRWCAWTFGLVFFFAWLYTLVGLDYGDYPTPLSPIYYSVVTLTTLGYGDVVPTTTGAQLVAMLEVFTGYVMLGGLLSIFSNRMSRRAD